MIAGYATPEGTKKFVCSLTEDAVDGHYSDFSTAKIKLSSLGVGTFPGSTNPNIEEQIVQLIIHAIKSGVNVVDTAAHYRYGRVLAAVGAGLAASFSGDISREAMFIVSKGGFITFRGGYPQNFEQWFKKEIVEKKLGRNEDLVNKNHLLSPEYIDYQIDLSRNLMGLETLDAFLVDQPEVHIPVIGKEKTNQKLLKIFRQLEKAIQQNRIRAYGISTYEGMRSETDDIQFQSITSMIGLAEKAALEVNGLNSNHGFKLIQVPFNHVMTEAFTRFSHATGQGNVASTLQAAFQLGVYVMASHTLMKGNLAQSQYDTLQGVLPDFENAAQRSMQFNRSTPGLGTSLVGMSQLPHLSDMLTVCQSPMMVKKDYLSLYSKA